MEVVMQPVESWTHVSGTVVSESGSPLSDRTVLLRPIGRQQSYQATTNRDGSFAFPGVESPAEYRLVVQGEGRHQDFEQEVHVHSRLGELDVVVEPWEFGKLTGQPRLRAGPAQRGIERTRRTAANG